jgi:AraC-like DNA-binding protein
VRFLVAYQEGDMYEYRAPNRANRGLRNLRPEARITRELIAKGSVVTLLEPALRELVSTATEEVFVSVHADNLDAARRALEDREAYAVLLSPGALEREQMGDIATLLARHPGVFPVAVIHRHGPGVSERLLALGRCGVSKVVDLDTPDGCQSLRAMLEESGGVITKRIASALGAQLVGASESSLKFFSYLVRSAPSHATVREFSRFLQVKPSTLLSRFHRVGLHSPKAYLAHTRLLYAAAYLESPALSIANVAYRLEYSSPQSLGRHIRTCLGITASAFRQRGFDAILEDFAARLIKPKVATLGRFDPFN